MDNHVIDRPEARGLSQYIDYLNSENPNSVKFRNQLLILRKMLLLAIKEGNRNTIHPPDVYSAPFYTVKVILKEWYLKNVLDALINSNPRESRAEILNNPVAENAPNEERLIRQIETHLVLSTKGSSRQRLFYRFYVAQDLCELRNTYGDAEVQRLFIEFELTAFFTANNNKWNDKLLQKYSLILNLFGTYPLFFECGETWGGLTNQILTSITDFFKSPLSIHNGTDLLDGSYRESWLETIN